MLTTGTRSSAVVYSVGLSILIQVFGGYCFILYFQKSEITIMAPYLQAAGKVTVSKQASDFLHTAAQWM